MSGRTQQQNRQYFALLGDLARVTGASVDDLHDIAKRRFLARPIEFVDARGALIRIGIVGCSTRELSIVEFAALIERVARWAATLQAGRP